MSFLTIFSNQVLNKSKCFINALRLGDIQMDGGHSRRTRLFQLLLSLLCQARCHNAESALIQMACEELSKARVTPRDENILIPSVWNSFTLPVPSHNVIQGHQPANVKKHGCKNIKHTEHMTENVTRGLTVVLNSKQLDVHSKPVIMLLSDFCFKTEDNFYGTL